MTRQTHHANSAFLTEMRDTTSNLHEHIGSYCEKERMFETTNWTASQGEELMDPAEDKELLNYMRRFDRVKTFEEMVKSHNIINIKKMWGGNQYYFACALVTVKAYVDKDPAYSICNMSRTIGEGYIHANHLFKEVDLPLNTYDLPDVQKMQDYLGPQGYQIKVFQARCGVLWFHDSTFDVASKKLWLLKNGEQFKGLRRVPECFRGGNYCEYFSGLFIDLGKVFCCHCKR